MARRTSRARHRDIHRLGTCSLPTSFSPNNISPLFLKFCLDVGCVDSSISDSASLGVVCRLWLGSNGKLHIDTSLQANSEKQEGPHFQMVREVTCRLDVGAGWEQIRILSGHRQLFCKQGRYATSDPIQGPGIDFKA